MKTALQRQASTACVCMCTLGYIAKIFFLCIVCYKDIIKKPNFRWGSVFSLDGKCSVFHEHCKLHAASLANN